MGRHVMYPVWEFARRPRVWMCLGYGVLGALIGVPLSWMIGVAH